MKITQEMIDEWSGPNGYCDFQYCNYRFATYDGGILVIDDKDQSYTFRAVKGSRSCPIWENGDCSHLIVSNNMAEPEFSLDEIALGEELIRG